MPFDDRGKAPSGKRFQQTAEHRILIAHAKHFFLSLFNQKDTTKPRWRLACSHNSLTHSRTALRLRGMTIEREDTNDRGFRQATTAVPLIRNEAALKAWPGQAAEARRRWSRICRSIDPHHHFLGHPAARPLPAAGAAGRHWRGAQHCLHGLPRMPLEYRKDGPAEMAPIGEVDSSTASPR